MIAWVFVLLLSVVALIAAGIYLDRHPRRIAPAWIQGGLILHLALWAAALLGILWLGSSEVMAQAPMGDSGREYSVGLGLMFIGIGLPTGLAAIAAAIALGPIGSAALAVIAEKPELFGRSLIYLGLAEGIAIYGLVMSILLLNRL